MKNELSELARFVGRSYEHRAKDCSTCEVKGICCADAHFVNVRITPLEAEAIRSVIDTLPAEQRDSVYRNIEETVSRSGLSDPDRAEATYACPLLNKEMGCIVHGRAKPLPCILHACYEERADMPPAELQTAMEERIARLNLLASGRTSMLKPLPLAILPRR